MNKYITAFFMAWGNFLSIPCPVKKWDDKLKNEMLKMLPSVGLVVGLLWFVLAVLLLRFNIPSLLSGFILTAYIYGITGFLHLDGFMDCRDAIMSRRSMEEKQRILKDSHVGAFAVISLVILIFGMFAASTAYMSLVNGIAESSSGSPSWMYLLPLIVIPVMSRHEAGLGVLRYKAMKTSQYAEFDESKSDEPNRIAPAPISMGLQTIVYVMIPFIVGIIVSENKYIEGVNIGNALEMFSGGEIKFLIPFVLSWCLTIVATHFSIKNARRELGGMNGDIAGQGICIGELLGMFGVTISLAVIS